MSNKYYTIVYRGWTLKQTENHMWEIVNSPNRDKSGPISPGPYVSRSIAEHVVDRIMDNSYGANDNPRNQNSNWGNSRNNSYNNYSGEPVDIKYYFYTVIAIGVFFGINWLYSEIKAFL